MRYLLLLSLLFTIGCIPKSRYDAALADATAARQAKQGNDRLLADAMKEIADLRGKLATAESNLAMLESGKSIDSSELEDLRRQKAAAEARAKLFDDLIAKLKKMIDAGTLNVTVRRGQIVIELGTDVLFDQGKTDLKPEGQLALVEVAKALRTLQGRRFQVAGHTDNLPIKTKTFPSNWELSTERGVVVVKLLLKEGVSASVLSAAGYADVDPIAPNTSAPGRARNRRIEIVLVPNVEDLGFQLKRLAGEKKADAK